MEMVIKLLIGEEEVFCLSRVHVLYADTTDSGIRAALNQPASF